MKFLCAKNFTFVVWYSLIFILVVCFYLICVFVLQIFLLKSLEILLIASFTMPLMCNPLNPPYGELFFTNVFFICKLLFSTVWIFYDHLWESFFIYVYLWGSFYFCENFFKPSWSVRTYFFYDDLCECFKTSLSFLQSSWK